MVRRVSNYQRSAICPRDMVGNKISKQPSSSFSVFMRVEKRRKFAPESDLKPAWKPHHARPYAFPRRTRTPISPAENTRKNTKKKTSKIELKHLPGPFKLFVKRNSKNNRGRIVSRDFIALHCRSELCKICALAPENWHGNFHAENSR